MDITHFIYSLACPISKQIRYIGQTNNLGARYRKHLHTSLNKPKTYCQCWINGLIKKGEKPMMEVVADCTIGTVNDEERFYISLFRYWGFDLTNLDTGGGNGRELSEVSRRKVSLSLTGKKQSDATKLKRSIVNTEAWKDEGLRAVQRERTARLNKLGITGTKGKPSKKKGKPFVGDRMKVSASLKKYYSQNVSPRKIIFNIDELVLDYNNESIRLVDVAKKYNVSRTLITNAMRENNIPLRNNGKRTISKDTLIQLRLVQRLEVKQIANTLKCSVRNVEKFIRLFKVYIKKAA